MRARPEALQQLDKAAQVRLCANLYSGMLMSSAIPHEYAVNHSDTRAGLPNHWYWPSTAHICITRPADVPVI